MFSVMSLAASNIFIRRSLRLLEQALLHAGYISCYPNSLKVLKAVGLVIDNIGNLRSNLCHLSSKVLFQNNWWKKTEGEPASPRLLGKWPLKWRYPVGNRCC